MPVLNRRKRNGAPCGAPFCLLALLCLLFAWPCRIALAAPETPVAEVASADLQMVRESLVEAIEAEGLVVSAVIPFGQMLERTAEALKRSASPFRQAEIVQFCSSRLAWEMVAEAPEQMAHCPLGIAVYALKAEPGKVFLSYRAPGRSTPARAQADELLRRLVARAVELAR